MARTAKNQPLDLSHAVELTAGAIDRLSCPDGKGQAFLRDTKAPGLRVRVTAAGAKSFVFEGKLDRQTIRRTIGDVRAWTLPNARAEANRLRVLLDGGKDPRALDREAAAARVEATKQAALADVTVGDAWAAYLAARKDSWGARHYADHEKLAQQGGKETMRGTRGRGKTQAGPIYPLLSLRLVDLTPEAVEAWAAKNGQERPTYGRLAWRCLRAFLQWCSEEKAYSSLVPVNSAKTRKARESFGKASQKRDVLLREQMPAWFASVQKLPSSTLSAYLQALLLTGARRGELLRLKWSDVNQQWRGMTIRDKVEGDRQIPLTPYVAKLLYALPCINEYVFASQVKKKAHIADPNGGMADACAAAGLSGLTLHGLRRSFKSLTEWLDIPAGVVAQIMGHKPSATAEKHYTVRPLDLLRVHHEHIEAWMIEQAGLPPVKAEEGARLQAVA
jgi:integrase